MKWIIKSPLRTPSSSDWPWPILNYKEFQKQGVFFSLRTAISCFSKLQFHHTFHHQPSQYFNFCGNPFRKFCTINLYIQGVFSLWRLFCMLFQSERTQLNCPPFNIFICLHTMKDWMAKKSIRKEKQSCQHLCLSFLLT